MKLGEQRRLGAGLLEFPSQTGFPKFCDFSLDPF